MGCPYREGSGSYETSDRAGYRGSALSRVSPSLVPHAFAEITENPEGELKSSSLLSGSVRCYPPGQHSPFFFVEHVLDSVALIIFLQEKVI